MNQWPTKYVALAHQWHSALRYLWNGPNEIEAQYLKAHGAAFTVATPGNLHTCVSSDQQINELEKAPENHLSLHAIAKDMFQPKYTMIGYEVKEEPTANSQNYARWSSVRTFSFAKTVVTKANSCVFFGDDIANDSEFLAAAQRYPQDVFITGEILRFTPSALAPTIAFICTGGHSAAKILVEHLTMKVQSRLETQGQNGKKSPDCLQWIIDSSQHRDAWTTKRIVQETLALWFGSVHQLAMSFTYVLYDLCDHPEYIVPLREELERTHLDDSSAWQPENMPRLDSFLKESARLNPSDAISIRRKVLAPYTFSDGTHFTEGSWACVPQRSLMRDVKNYPSASSFQGFRFMPSSGSPCGSKFTDTGPKFPFWGAGKRVCPGRFYASVALKIMVAHVLLDFDFRLLSPEASRTFSWRSAIIPRSSTVLQMRRRSCTCT
ncbi:cytochrome P450 [Usnea florida]